MDELNHGGECPVKMQLKKGYNEGQKKVEKKKRADAIPLPLLFCKMSLNSVRHNRIIEAMILMQLHSAIMHFYMRGRVTLYILPTPRSAMVKVENECNT